MIVFFFCFDLINLTFFLKMSIDIMLESYWARKICLTLKRKGVLNAEEEKQLKEESIKCVEGYVVERVKDLVESEIQSMNNEQLKMLITSCNKLRSRGPESEYYEYCRGVLTRLKLM